MAHMIPSVPMDFDDKSDEYIVFNALKRGLSDEYYVFHSVVVKFEHNKALEEREIDFVVLHKKKGMLLIEAKNGYDIYCSGRTWFYSSGKPMKHGGPYNQVESAKFALRNKVKEHLNPEVQALAGKIIMKHAVWFFGTTQNHFLAINRDEGLPEEASMELTMFQEDLINPQKRIDEILGLKPAGLSDSAFCAMGLNDEQFKTLLEKLLCPEFNLVPQPGEQSMMEEFNMNQLLYEQYRLLDFLEEQPSAAINGAAGTGKTMIAVEKARRNSMDGERVLFLCYNRMLCDKLNADNKNSASRDRRQQFKNVDFMTISQLAYQMTGNFQNYDGLMECLLDDADKFPYQHVIVDEGQDFGIIAEQQNETDADNNVTVIDTLQEVMLEKGGTFYIFYDKYQMIQGGGKVKYKLLHCIEDSDCRLTLHCNCRNTFEIARTSVTPLRDSKNRAIKPRTAHSFLDNAQPVMHLIGSKNSALSVINGVLDKYREAGVKDVVILTAGVPAYSWLADKLEEENDKYTYEYNGVSYPVTTCIKFKGLEAGAILLIDLGKDSFTEYEGLKFYVGTSRAKHYLDFVAKLSPAEYAEVIHKLDEGAPIKGNEEKLRKIMGGVFSADMEQN